MGLRAKIEIIKQQSNMITIHYKFIEKECHIHPRTNDATNLTSPKHNPKKELLGMTNSEELHAKSFEKRCWEKMDNKVSRNMMVGKKVRTPEADCALEPGKDQGPIY